MIKITTTFDKNAFAKKQNEALFMVELQAPKKKVLTNKEIQQLNIALAIDISGSMGEPVKGRGLTSRLGFFVNQANGIQELASNLPEIAISKMEQAKRAALKAMETMRNGDILSVVSFDDQITVVVPSTVLSNENRSSIKEKINSLNPRGMTNIYDGWHAAATEVAKNIKAKSINRVILLTDGQANTGITNMDTICSNVLLMKNASISTSTFGIGEQFNEDLLQGMANSGDGNSYYITNDSQLQDFFKDEFNGLNNMYATDIKMYFEFEKNQSVIEQVNGLILDKGKYSVPNLISEGKNSLLFKLQIKVSKNTNEHNVGKLIVSFKDSDGVEQIEKVDITNAIVTQKEWDSLPFNQEIKVQEALMLVANKKLEATRAIDAGNMTLAKNILNGSMQFMASASASFNDSRLNTETAAIGASLSNADSMSKESFRKDLSYSSYITRSGKNDK